MKFERGEIVRVLLTGELGMVVDLYTAPYGCSAYKKGYDVRMNDYSVKRFFEFELGKREVDDGGPDKP